MRGNIEVKEEREEWRGREGGEGESEGVKDRREGERE